MVELGNQDRRDRGSKESSARSERYVELSLKGRWVALARDWLQNNPSCTTFQYFEAVTPLMPKHICRSGVDHKTSQLALAKEALKILVKGGSVCINGDCCKVTQRSTTRGQSHLWRELATASVNLADVAKKRGLTKKQTVAFRQWLRTNGYCSKGKGVLTKIESTEQ